MPIGKNSDGHQKTLRCPSVGTVAPNAQDSHDGNVFVLRRNRSDDGPVNRPRRSPTPKGTDSPLPYIYIYAYSIRLGDRRGGLRGFGALSPSSATAAPSDIRKEDQKRSTDTISHPSA